MKCQQHNSKDEKCGCIGHYSHFIIENLEDIKTVFPTGKADSINWLIASTSGVHGTYASLDEIEKTIHTPLTDQKEEDYYPTELTVLIIHPRLVTFKYGCVEIKKQEDIDYLRGLITSSIEEIKKSQQNNLLV